MRQIELFATPDEPTVLVGDHGDVRYIRAFLEPGESSELRAELSASTAFQADSRMMYGRRVLVPRETAARGEGCAQPWSPRLDDVRRRLETYCATLFDYVFVNRYRNGNDSVAWHADHDAHDDPRRTIASLSLGATRRFDVRPSRAGGLRHHPISVDLADGDLVIMRGATQLYWEHRVAKDPRVGSERINLTFRQRRVPA